MGKIDEMRESMLKAGVYSTEDIEEICRLEEEYSELCDEISEECEEEGYPSYGENYDLRCTEARKYYDEKIAMIDAKYEIDDLDKKSYKEFEKENIGASDIASLILVGPGESGLQLKELAFGEDGAYDAYMVDGEDVEIGSHYKEVFEFKNWLKIYDDDGLVYRTNAERIKIYRAGEFGCIIQRINDGKSISKDLNQQINSSVANMTGRSR